MKKVARGIYQNVRGFWIRPIINDRRIKKKLKATTLELAICEKEAFLRKYGCHQLGIEVISNGRITHDRSKSRLYRNWNSMRWRCSDRATGSARKHYFERGIRVCDRWQIFENFLQDMGVPLPGLEIDRINNDLGYCKENCRWTTREINARNTRGNRFLTARGKSQCLKAWAIESGINPGTLHGRLLRGWTIDAALDTPTGKYSKKLSARRVLDCLPYADHGNSGNPGPRVSGRG